ncbi:TetR/AcrR family transcriptional regulator [Thioclava sp. BHET1]|nr:TetR/AcrR family transcriptional regulator [Thioclava sp. BHET1]
MKDESRITDVRDHILATAQTIMSVKGFSGVGLNEILKAAEVPKGSFYHYFGSKEAFGAALLERYFESYLAAMDEMLLPSDASGRRRLNRYWQHWLETQTAEDPQSKCLVVKLAAEVSDLSEAMRQALLNGTRQITTRLAEVIGAGVEDGSLSIEGSPQELAEQLYQSWLGASLLAKITKNDAPLHVAMTATQNRLG